MKLFRNKLFLGILCIAAGLLAGFVLLPKAQHNAAETQTVLVMKAPVQAGTQLTADMVTTKNLPKGAFSGALTKPADAVGKYAASDLYAGDVLTGAKLTDTKDSADELASAAQKGKQVVSITLPTQAAGVSGRLLPGDIVLVMATPKYTSQSLGLNPDADGSTPQKQFAGTAVVPGLEALEVCMVTTADGADAHVSAQPPDNEKNTLPATISFYATPAQAIKLAELEQDSVIHLALVSRGASTETEGK